MFWIFGLLNHVMMRFSLFANMNLTTLNGEMEYRSFALFTFNPNFSPVFFHKIFTQNKS